MDITSLPQEMLANVLKYQDLATFQQLRKTSSHINSIAERYGLTERIKVSEMKISDFIYDGDLYIVLRQVTMLNDEYDFPIERRFDFGINSKGLLELLRKIRITNLLCLYGYVKVNETFVSMLHTHKKTFKHCTTLCFQHTQNDLSMEMNKKLLSIFPKVREIDIMLTNNKDVRRLVNKEMLVEGDEGSVVLGTISLGNIPYKDTEQILRSIEGVRSVKKSDWGYASCHHKLVLQGEGIVVLGTVSLGNIPYKDTEEILRSIKGVASVYKSESGYHQVKLISERYVRLDIDDPETIE